MRRAVGVVLAAGASRRMGRQKALVADAKGHTFLDHVCTALSRGGCSLVIVVGGAHAENLAPVLPDGVLLAVNREWERGQLSSARVGLRAALSAGAEDVLVQPVDQPLLAARDVKTVVAALAKSPLVVPVHRGERGHPLGISAAVAKKVLASRARTLREAVEASGRIREVPAGQGVVRGANTPEELARLGFGDA